MTFIPTKVIAAYAPVICTRHSKNAGNPGNTVTLGLSSSFFCFQPAAIILIAYGKCVHPPPKPDTPRFRFPAFAAFVAFAAWGTVRPSTAFPTASWFSAWMGTASVIQVTFLFTLLGPILQGK
jgi:hypothetical protein